MKNRTRSPGKYSAAEVLVLRDRLGMKGYRKRRKRDPREREILIELGLDRIKRAEEENFVPIGFRRRRVKLLP
jgi:hypothetical protein